MQLKTFGGLSIVVADGSVVTGAATQRRRLALLAVLAAAGGSGITRERLIGMFWPDQDEERARAALAQALYALRKAIGVEELVVGTTSLRLNEIALPSDVATFRKAVSQERWTDAAAAWTGPFLDGVVLPEAEGFERWAETERAVLAREVLTVLERLARDAEQAGQWKEAVHWWQRRVAVDPLAAAGTIGLMEAMAAAGDVPAALRHARVYETLVEQELELTPEAAVMDLKQRLMAGAHKRRSGPATRTAHVPVGDPERDAVAQEQGGLKRTQRETASRRAEGLRPRRYAAGWLIGAGAVVALGAASVLMILRRGDSPPPVGHAQVLAVGGFAAYGADLVPAARALTDMLATNLAQVPGLNVLSSVRVYELAAGMEGDTVRALLSAARLAGATDVIDGALYETPGGVRLDLRRTDLVSGEVVHAVTVSGPDVFAAVDEGTTRLMETIGGRSPARPVADVTTSSLVSYRLYVEGLRAYFDGQRAAAHRLFTSALEEDSTFAMAAYYAMLAGEGSRAQKVAMLQRAVRLADGAGDRERLLIQWQWANEMDDPSRAALADTLVARYASEPFAHVHHGRVLVAQGRYGDALTAFRKAVALEPREQAAVPGHCTACEARGEIIFVLRGLDSLEAAEREARNAIRAERSGGAWLQLAEVMTVSGRVDEAEDAYRRVEELSPQLDVPRQRAMAGIRHGMFETTDAELLARMRSGNVYVRADAEWWLTFSYRAQGRLSDASEVARTMRERDSTWGQRGAAPYLATVSAAVLYERGRFRQAAALWDSIARLRTPGETESRNARHQVWFMSLAATGLAAAGDTVGLAGRADTVEVLGRQSAYIRDQRLHHHVRGLLYAARGRHEEAVEAFERARLMPTVGYGRTVQFMARSLSSLGRHEEAVAVLRPFLAGPLDGANTYLPMPEIHEQLAELYLAAGRRDSAVTHAARAAMMWRNADPIFEARRRRMEDIAER